MIIRINEKEYEVSTKLGTTFRMEERFNKPYLRVLNGIEDLKLKEQIDMLVCGITDKEEQKAFREDVMEYGIGNVQEWLEEFIEGLQYPGLTSEEIEEKKLQKLEKQKKYQRLGLIN